MASQPPDDRFAQGSTPSQPPDERIARGEPVPPAPRLPPAPPVPAEELPSLTGGGGAGLSSLAQSAREKQINTARWILIAVGMLTTSFTIAMFFVMQGNIDTDLRKA